MFARTQAATYSTELHYQGVSAKIASFYTPEAAAFVIDTVTGKFLNTGCQFTTQQFIIFQLNQSFVCLPVLLVFVKPVMPYIPDRLEKTAEQKKAAERALRANPGEIANRELIAKKSAVGHNRKFRDRFSHDIPSIFWIHFH